MSDSTSSGVMGRVQRLRQRYPAFDHLMRMNEHYGKVQGSVQAGAVTYFGFLSFFPILALSFSVVGYVSLAYPDARDSLVTAIQQIFPGIVSTDGSGNTISLTDIENSKEAAGIIGFLTLLYSGLGWISGLRVALENAFVVPPAEKRSFVVGKAVDLVTLGLIGAILIVSVGLAGVVKGLAGDILDFVGLDDTAIGPPLIWTLGILLGVAASTLLFFTMFRLLGSPELPNRPLLHGALFGAIGFEALKLIVVNVLGQVGGSPFAPLAIAITLVVWINYFSRLILYGASWAYTSPLAHDTVDRRTDSSEAAITVAALAEEKSQFPVGVMAHGGPGPDESDQRPRSSFDVGSAIFGAVGGAIAAVLFGKRDW